MFKMNTTHFVSNPLKALNPKGFAHTVGIQSRFRRLVLNSKNSF
jgi:hypothetical protein